jgi:lipoprotein-anchoring transpeptidase ErfK/SrfK
MLDTSLTMDTLQKKTIDVVQLGRLELSMSVIPPQQIDPEPYIKAATKFVSQAFTLNGYDPFTDQTTTWTTTKESLASWLEVGDDGLVLRDANYAAFLNAQIQSLNPPTATETRYLDPRETQDKMNKAISEQAGSVMLRIRYRDTRFTVESGDRAYSISRKTGIPFYLIQEANPGRNLDVLSVGDVLNLPSKDKAVPLDPVPNKRIVVDLDNQSMIAFENGQEKFRWLISSGMDKYPTSPGIYQILTHSEEAAGGSFTLCSNSGLNCGSWTMYWFMGMYEVVPGLMNGFHGAVLPPNGNLLGGGSVGSEYTFGCVMAENDNAKMLYDWADEGTVVEIISGEFAPQSDLGQRVLSEINNT